MLNIKKINPEWSDSKKIFPYFLLGPNIYRYQYECMIYLITYVCLIVGF